MTRDSTAPTARQTTRYNFVRIATGLVLLVAASLKAYYLATEPFLAEGLFQSRWFLIAVVEAELFLALWLFAGIWPATSSIFALLCFGAFASISFTKAISGESNCGCFGNVEVHPWISFAVSTIMISALLATRPTVRAASSNEGIAISRWRFRMVLVIWLLMGLPAGLAMEKGNFATLTMTGDLTGASEIVPLDPYAWVGNQFGVAKHIDIGDKLDDGVWIVLFFKHGCGSCKEAVAQYQQLAKRFHRKSRCPKIALIELPTPSGTHPLAGEGVEYGQLANTKRWKMRTPISMLVDHGRVQSVFEFQGDTTLLETIWGTAPDSE